MVAVQLSPRNRPTLSTSAPKISIVEACGLGSLESAVAGVKQTIPLGRLTEPKDTANASLFLASD